MKTEEKLDFDKVWLMFQETDKKLKELTKSSKENEKRIKSLEKQNKQLKQNYFEDNDYNSNSLIYNVLTDKFKVENVGKGFKNLKSKTTIDYFGYSNGKLKVAYIVNIKYDLVSEDIDQMLDLLHKFKVIFPIHKDKKVYGILSSVTINDELKERLNKLGIYHATSGENLFKIDSPKNFKPIAY